MRTEIKVRIQLWGGIGCVIAAAMMIIYANFIVLPVSGPSVALWLKMSAAAVFGTGCAGIIFFVAGDSKNRGDVN